MSEEKPRWKYRFNNFSRAYTLLQEANEKYSDGSMTQLEKEGMIQRFEYCMELAWKAAKDYLEYNNVVFGLVTPRAIIKEAIAANLIHDGEGWMTALDVRNKMSRTYDFKKFEEALEQISKRYLACFGELYEVLGKEF